MKHHQTRALRGFARFISPVTFAVALMSGTLLMCGAARANVLLVDDFGASTAAVIEVMTGAMSGA